jgi:lysozyme
MAAWREREQEEIKLDEGLRLKAYKDSLGYWTIGYGHFLGATPIPDITLEKAEELFEEDFLQAEEGARQAAPFFDALTGPRKGALVNMAFNLGAKKLSEFHGTLNALDMGEWDTAALHIMNSRYARQVKNRANRIAYRIRTNEYSLR